MLALIQPVLATFRPAANDGMRRRVWSTLHVLTAVALLGAGAYACVSGAQKATGHHLEFAAQIEACTYMWLCFVALALVGLQARRSWRARPQARPLTKVLQVDAVEATSTRAATGTELSDAAVSIDERA